LSDDISQGYRAPLNVPKQVEVHLLARTKAVRAHLDFSVRLQEYVQSNLACSQASLLLSAFTSVQTTHVNSPRIVDRLHGFR